MAPRENKHTEVTDWVEQTLLWVALSTSHVTAPPLTVPEMTTPVKPQDAEMKGPS